MQHIVTPIRARSCVAWQPPDNSTCQASTTSPRLTPMQLSCYVSLSQNFLKEKPNNFSASRAIFASVTCQPLSTNRTVVIICVTYNIANDLTPSQSNVIVTSTPICNHYDRTWSWGHCSGTIGLSQDCVRPSMYCTTHVGYIFHVIPLALLV